MTGLGFNAVYHFTDCPSFVSGDHLVLFDPHTAYLPGATPQQPGLRIQFTANDMLHQFPDQFEVYKLFGCDFQNRFDGTLFRFPLRSSTTAPLSEIKNEPYSEESMNSLLQHFMEFAPQTLLFLRGVRELEVYMREGQLLSLTFRTLTAKADCLCIQTHLVICNCYIGQLLLA